MKAKIKAGTTSRILDLYIEDSSSSTGAGLGSLVYNSSGLTCKYKRRGQSSWTTVSLVTATAGTWTSGGFIAAGSAPTGAYEFHVPDAALASGATGVVIILEGATNMVPCRIEIELDAIDYQDSVRLGLTALPNVAQGSAGQLPTADANGRVDVSKLGGDATALDRLKQMFSAARLITVDSATFAPTTTTFETDQTTDDSARYTEQALFGLDGSNAGVTSPITSYAYANGKVKLTVEALPASPSNGHRFIIMGRIEQ